MKNQHSFHFCFLLFSSLSTSLLCGTPLTAPEGIYLGNGNSSEDPFIVKELFDSALPLQGVGTLTLDTTKNLQFVTGSGVKNYWLQAWAGTTTAWDSNSGNIIAFQPPNSATFFSGNHFGFGSFHLPYGPEQVLTGINLKYIDGGSGTLETRATRDAGFFRWAYGGGTGLEFYLSGSGSGNTFSLLDSRSNGATLGAIFHTSLQNSYFKTQKLGIGTISPTQQLDVVGNVKITKATPADNLPVLDISGGVAITNGALTVNGSPVVTTTSGALNVNTLNANNGINAAQLMVGSPSPNQNFQANIQGNTRVSGDFTAQAISSSTIFANNLIVDLLLEAGDIVAGEIEGTALHSLGNLQIDQHASIDGELFLEGSAYIGSRLIAGSTPVAQDRANQNYALVIGNGTGANHQSTALVVEKGGAVRFKAPVILEVPAGDIPMFTE